MPSTIAVLFAGRRILRSESYKSLCFRYKKTSNSQQPTMAIGKSSWHVADYLQKRSLLIAVNSVAALSIFFFGYDQGMMGGVNNAKDYIDLMGFGYVDSVTGDPVVTNSLLQGGIVSVYYLGTLFGCLLGGWVGDKVGRIKTIALGAAWAVLGASLQCSAQNHDWMICGTCRDSADSKRKRNN